MPQLSEPASEIKYQASEGVYISVCVLTRLRVGLAVCLRELQMLLQTATLTVAQ